MRRFKVRTTKTLNGKTYTGSIVDTTVGTQSSSTIPSRRIWALWTAASPDNELDP